MSETAANLAAGCFLAVCAFGAIRINQMVHAKAPPPLTSYEQDAIPMSYIDQCGEEPVCVWWWQYDDGAGTINKDTKLPEMPGWVLHYGPQSDVPADARPAKSLPVLAVQP